MSANYNAGSPPARVVLVDPETLLDYTAIGGGGGGGDAVVIAGANGTSGTTQINPLPVTVAQGIIASGPIALAANTAATLIAAFADRRGMRVLNYISAPVYLSLGVTGTPASGAGSDYIPAAVGGIPGQWEPPFAPVGGVRAVCATAGSLTVTVW